jgi:uncharacterized protein (TIGR03086 family)
MSTQPLEQAIAVSRGVLANVSPDQLDAATPCASWNVAALINHIVGAQHFFANGLEGTEAAGEAPDFAAGDYKAAFDEATGRCLAAFQAEGVMSKTVTMPFGALPAPAVLGLAVTDTLQHAWDLARATGQSSDLAPELAAGVLAQARPMISDAFRGPDGAAPFGPEQAAPDSASPADQLAAFLGRQV